MKGGVELSGVLYRYMDKRRSISAIACMRSVFIVRYLQARVIVPNILQ